jgi:hypothetical protein
MARETSVPPYQIVRTPKGSLAEQVPLSDAVGMFQRAITALQDTQLPDHSRQGNLNMVDNALAQDFAGVVVGAGCVRSDGSPDVSTWFGYAVQSIPGEYQAEFVRRVITELSAMAGENADTSTVTVQFTEQLGQHITSIPVAYESQTTYTAVHGAFTAYSSTTGSLDGVETLVRTVESLTVA